MFSSRRRHTRCGRDWSSDVCSSDLGKLEVIEEANKGQASWRLFGSVALAELQEIFAYVCAADEVTFTLEETEATLEPTEEDEGFGDRKSTRLNSSHVRISYAVFCLK